MSKLGETVRTLRVQRRLTQRQVVERGGTTLSLVTALEAGRRRYVTVADLDALARGLQVPIQVLWECIPEAGRTLRFIPLQ